MGAFELVNPIIAGNIITKFDVDTPMNAAKKFWDTLTVENNLIVNEVFKFMFTLQNQDGKYHHFTVEEKEKSNGEIKYEINDVTKEVEQKANKSDMQSFKKEVERVKGNISGNPKGGKKSSSSSSSSSSDDNDDEFDYYKLRRRMNKTPISFWWYSPMIYKVRRIFTPVFVKPIAPYVQLWMPM